MRKTIEIPEGYEARIENNKVILEPKENAEEERIRKAIIKHFNVGTDYITFSGFSKEQIIAWLEKQKNNISLQELLTSFRENTNEKWDFSKTPQVREELNKCFGKHMILPWNDNTRLTVSDLMRCAAHFYEFGKKEQDPAWSDEDAISINEIIETLNIVQANRLRTQRTHYSKATIDKDIAFLKSLKERCTWKPSDEQMYALQHIIACYHGDYEYLADSLYNDLKKIKG